MTLEYKDFLHQKNITVASSGFGISETELNPVLKPHQAALTLWALRKGRSAIFADTGLGKTLMQLEWTRMIARYVTLPVLIVAPLSVARQTVSEARRLLGLDVYYSRRGDDIGPITITNYEMASEFNPANFAGVVLDESSILKSIDGKTKARLIEMFGATPYRLCCTATPAPNDIAEIANHSEFLGIKSRTEMLAEYFVHDDEGWRLKGHAVEPFYRWLASWGMSVRMPSDLGFSDEGYILPPLNIQPVFVSTDYRPDDQLFFTGLKGIGDRAKVRKGTIQERCQTAIEIAQGRPDQVIVWCGLNSEQDMIAGALGSNCVSIHGGLSIDEKERRLELWLSGKVKDLVSKPSVLGFGMNFQNSHAMVFVGLSDSYESYYQCIRRAYRFGQEYQVDAFVVLSEIEDGIYHNILRKEKEAREMSDNLIKNVQEYERQEIGTPQGNSTWEYREAEAKGNAWELWLGDSVERMKEMADSSVDLSVFSPPFQSLYTYTPTERDLGNSRTEDEFYTHFGFIISDLLRVTKLGRICAVHVADVPAMLVRDGYIGLKDFSGDVIREFIKRGWIFDSRIPIDKNQQAQSIRTHAKGLTMTQMEKDRTWSRPALPDYILKFRKPGDNQVPVNGGEITRNLWIEYANPTWPNENDRCAEAGAFATWYGISESDTLQGWQNARSEKDERHICPLQIGTIERVIKLWSNKGELVFTPFAGIGSEVHTAVKLGRRGFGIELKPEYYNTAIKNLRQLERELTQVDLFSLMGVTV